MLCHKKKTLAFPGHLEEAHHEIVLSPREEKY